jgi:hypothetical protein
VIFLVSTFSITKTFVSKVSFVRKFKTPSRLNSYPFKMSNIIDGTAIAAQIRVELKASVEEFKKSTNVTPGKHVTVLFLYCD